MAVAAARFAEDGRFGIDAILRGIRSVQSVRADERLCGDSAGEALSAHETSQSALVGMLGFAAFIARTDWDPVNRKDNGHLDLGSLPRWFRPLRPARCRVDASIVVRSGFDASVSSASPRDRPDVAPDRASNQSTFHNSRRKTERDCRPLKEPRGW